MKVIKKHKLTLFILLVVSIICGGVSARHHYVENREQFRETKEVYLLSEYFQDLNVIEAEWSDRDYDRVEKNGYPTSVYYDLFVVYDDVHALNKVKVYDDQVNGKFMAKVINENE